MVNGSVKMFVSFMLFLSSIPTKKHTSDIGFGWALVTKPKSRNRVQVKDSYIISIVTYSLINSKV
jgi:hypothetical protein